MTSFSFFKYFDAFELGVIFVNFVYYGKTRNKKLALKQHYQQAIVPICFSHNVTLEIILTNFITEIPYQINRVTLLV